jgi:hypothetical protein
MIVDFFNKHTRYKKVGGLHFVRVFRFGFSFYISKPACK